MSLFQSIVTTVGMVSSLGIASSGVREIADAHGHDDPARVEKAVGVLKRISLLTGLLGWVLTATLAYPFARVALGDAGEAPAIILLGTALFFSSIAGGHAAILQGCRRIGDLARSQIVAALTSGLIAIGFYVWLRRDGIILSMIAAALIQLLCSWWFSRRLLPIEGTRVSWRETFSLSRRLLALGIAFMWNGLITSVVSLATKAFIVNQMGADANGIFQAAWAISGVFAGFILAAMGTDFYPRLTSVADEPDLMNRLVNEQTEIGVLLATPGLLVTLLLSPWLMKLLYTSDFSSGADMVPWFALGVFGQIVSWPLGYIQIAKGASRAFIVTQTLFNATHLALTVACIYKFGLVGASIAYVMLYLIYTFVMLAYNRKLTGFKWSSDVMRLVVSSTALIGVGFGASMLMSGWPAFAGGMIPALVAVTISLRGLSQRLPSEHRIARFVRMMVGLLPKAKKA